MTLPRTIVVGTDFSEQADKAVRYAIELAQRLGAAVHLVHGWTMPAGLSSLELLTAPAGSVLNQLGEEAQRAMAKSLQLYRTAHVQLEGTVVPEDARDAVVSVATKLSAQLVVVGTHGRRGVPRMLLGSVAEEVVRSAPCPVLVVR